VSSRTGAAEYSVEPRTKSASLGEANLPLNQGSDKTLSHFSELYMCACTLITSHFFGIADGIAIHGRCLVLVFARPRLRRLSNFVSGHGFAISQV
jgi:hypothetical protein